MQWHLTHIACKVAGICYSVGIRSSRRHPVAAAIGMKKLRETRGLLLIPLFLQMGAAPCPGACALVGCPSHEVEHSAFLDQALPPCHQASHKSDEGSNDRLSAIGLNSCCRGDSALPLALGPQQSNGKEIQPDLSAVGFVANEAGSVHHFPLVATHSGEPPPLTDSPPIYRLNCDLRI